MTHKNKHSLATRWFHWVHFPLLFIMIWSGLLIYWANQAYQIKLGNTVFFKFFPNSFYVWINGKYSLAEGLSYHFALMWLFIINGLLYILYLVFSKEYKTLLPKKRFLKDAWQVVLYDFKISKVKPLQGKYNAAQKMAYSGIIFLGILVCFTGFAIYKPVQLPNLVAFFGGYASARLIHFICTMLFVLFFLVHVIQVIFAGWQNFASIIRGFEIQEKKEILEQKNLYKRYQKKTILSFSIFILFFGLAFFGWKQLRNSPKDNKARIPLRTVLNINEKIMSAFLFSNSNLSKEFSTERAAKKVRVNGNVGMKSDLNYDEWRLHILTKKGDTLKISLDEIKKIPKQDIVFDFKCIEGWDQITHWGGVNFKTFLEHYHLEQESLMPFVGLESTDKLYYVGIDRESMLHPQTILAYEMNGKELPENQGKPLRLIIPTKYGVKHIKRIGEINFSHIRPRDYWYERGYDYYFGL